MVAGSTSSATRQYDTVVKSQLISGVRVAIVKIVVIKNESDEGTGVAPVTGSYCLDTELHRL